MNMSNKCRFLFVICKIFFMLGYLLIWYHVNIQAAIGVFLVGWALNIGSYLRTKYNISSLGRRME